MLSDRWQANLNAGASIVPDTQGATLDDYSGGASAVFAVSSRFRRVARVGRQLRSIHRRRQERARLRFAALPPGARYAWNLAGGQLVLGLAAPTGLSSDAPDWGVFFYLSFERRFWGESH